MVSAVADFDPTSLNVTFPPSTIETTASISLPSIIPDTINEAVEGLVLQLEVVSVDEDGLTESSRHVALLLITDDDSKITELQCMLQYLGCFVLSRSCM